MNETSIVASATGSGSVDDVSVAGVRALHRDDPRIEAQRFGELAATDVERVDAARAALQQDVGEPAGRRADVEADEPGRVDRERVEGRRELVPAPAHVRLGFRDRDRRIGREQVARLSIAAGRVALPHPDLAGQDERLRARSRLDQATLDQQLIQPLAGRLDGRAHPPIVAQPAAPGLTRQRAVAGRWDVGRQPAATSERPGSARIAARVSRTWSASPGASSRRTRRRSATEPWSTNRSPGIPTIRTATSR